MKKYRLQANISHWLADLTRRAAHIESRSISSYVTRLIMQDLQNKELLDEQGRPLKPPPSAARGRAWEELDLELRKNPHH